MTDDLAAFLDAVAPLVDRLRLPYVTDSAHREAANALDVLVTGWRKVLVLCDDWQHERTVTAENLAYEIRAALVEALSPTPTPTAEKTKT